MEETLLSEEEIASLECNPAKNKRAVVLIEGEDGNWRGFAHKFGKLIQVKAIDPNTVVTRLITHE